MDPGGGLRILDISNTAAPVEIGGFDTPGRVKRVEVSGTLAYLSGISSPLRIVELGPEYLPTRSVSIDIKPGNDQNPVNPASKGVTPVAVLGSQDFNVRDIDFATLAFGPGGALPAHWRGGHVKDVDHDGFKDLLSRYSTPEAELAFGDSEACVTGELFDGTAFGGCDSVRTAPACGLGYEVVLLLPVLLGLRGRRQRRYARS